MSPDDDRIPHGEQRLSPEAAFVVQFLAGSSLTSGNVRGRIEHIASGRSARFASVDELLRFVGELLAPPARCAKPPDGAADT